jgi:hypothetical protein
MDYNMAALKMLQLSTVCGGIQEARLLRLTPSLKLVDTLLF